MLEITSNYNLTCNINMLATKMNGLELELVFNWNQVTVMLKYNGMEPEDGRENSIKILPTKKLLTKWEKLSGGNLKVGKRWVVIVNLNLVDKLLMNSMEINGSLILKRLVLIMVKVIGKLKRNLISQNQNQKKVKNKKK